MSRDFHLISFEFITFAHDHLEVQKFDSLLSLFGASGLTIFVTWYRQGLDPAFSLVDLHLAAA